MLSAVNVAAPDSSRSGYTGMMAGRSGATLRLFQKELSKKRALSTCQMTMPPGQGSSEKAVRKARSWPSGSRFSTSQ